MRDGNRQRSGIWTTLAIAVALALGIAASSVAADAGDGASAAPAEKARAAKPEAGERSAYLIGVGDVLDVVVWKNPDASRKVQVRPDGRITLPLIGELVVEGMTTQELTRVVADKLKDFLTEPVVTISLEESKYSKPVKKSGLPADHKAEEGKTAEYRLGAEDVIEVVVWKNPDVSRQVWVRPDGRITLPLIGEVVAEGRTTQELTRILETRLTDYFTDPVVTVSLMDINSYSIYLLGKVAKPGPMKLRSPRTLLQVLSMAGGFQEFASSDKVAVVRWENGRSKRIPVDVEKLIAKDVQGDFLVQPGDVIIVP